jgi:hypothetical protein
MCVRIFLPFIPKMSGFGRIISFTPYSLPVHNRLDGLLRLHSNPSFIHKNTELASRVWVVLDAIQSATSNLSGVLHRMARLADTGQTCIVDVLRELHDIPVDKRILWLAYTYLNPHLNA